MKSAHDLFANINFILRLIEGVLCLLGLIFYYNVYGVCLVISFRGWLFLAVCYLLSYVWEDPNIWMEVFAIGVYATLMLITALSDLSQNCILPFVTAAVMIADIALLVRKGQK